MEIKACRICKNKKLIPIGSLGNIAISDFTSAPMDGDKYPLELIYCEKCTLLQLKHDTPRDLLYKNYWYESHINPRVVQDLTEIAALCHGDCIDIGGNDGTLLNNVITDGSKVLVDPSNIKHVSNNYLAINNYWENAIYTKPVDTITAIACLYDLPDPNLFVLKVKEALKPTGIFIAQLMTLQPFIENNDIGNICHEHLEYYSYKSLVTLFEQNGMEIFKVEENDVNGGSYRLFARHLDKGSIDFKEKEYTKEDLIEFFKRVELNKEIFLSFLETHDVYGYGASTKGNTILQYYGLGPDDIPAIVDVNPNKKGKYTIGSKIPVIDTIPDHCRYLWVMPWGFLETFKQKESKWLSYGNSFVLSTPEFETITS